MKSSKIKKALASLGVLAFAFSAFSLTAFAAEADSDNTTATVEFVAGDLTLVAAPSFNFGSHAIPTATTDYVPSTGGNAGSLSVSDLRGSGAGWKVTAALSTFVNSGSNSLPGATLSLAGATASEASGATTTAPVVQTTIVLTSDGTTVPVETASTNAGQGVWNTVWSAPTLNVLSGTAQAGQNVATIDWTLADAP